jgi:hypothetical protein
MCIADKLILLWSDSISVLQSLWNMQTSCVYDVGSFLTWSVWDLWRRYVFSLIYPIHTICNLHCSHDMCLFSPERKVLVLMRDKGWNNILSFLTKTDPLKYTVRHY